MLGFDRQSNGSAWMNNDLEHSRVSFLFGMPPDASFDVAHPHLHMEPYRDVLLEGSWCVAEEPSALERLSAPLAATLFWMPREPLYFDVATRRVPLCFWFHPNKFPLVGEGNDIVPSLQQEKISRLTKALKGFFSDADK